MKIYKEFDEKVISLNSVNKTLYIPLYGKSFVSQKGIILHDEKAQEIWGSQKFELKRKSKSKWLAYYMGMRCVVFDHWLRQQLEEHQDAMIIHIGCGLDSRNERVATNDHCWYDIDFPDVIEERKRYYQETNEYHMLKADIRENDWIDALPQHKNVIVVMEGVSMYLKFNELKDLFNNICDTFEHVSILMDCYTTFGVKASKYKNPINDVGVIHVYGIDNPRILEDKELFFVQEHPMIPEYLMNELKGLEKFVFKKIYGGKLSQKIYRLYEYKKRR